MPAGTTLIDNTYDLLFAIAHIALNDCVCLIVCCQKRLELSNRVRRKGRWWFRCRLHWRWLRRTCCLAAANLRGCLGLLRLSGLAWCCWRLHGWTRRGRVTLLWLNLLTRGERLRGDTRLWLILRVRRAVLRRCSWSGRNLGRLLTL